MKFLKPKFIFLLSVYGIILIMYSICRLAFIGSNVSELKITSKSNFFNILMQGLRYDISAVLYVNLIFTVLFLIFGTYVFKGILKQFFKYLFILLNAFFLLLNCIDIVYFPFIQKRMQSDALLFATGEKGGEAWGMLPHFILQYFWLWIIWGLMVWIVIRFYGIAFNRFSLTIGQKDTLFSNGLVWMTIIAINLTGLRGGWQLRPINTINAAEVEGVENAPAVLNSTFSLIRTWQKKSLSYHTWFQENELTDCEKGIHISEAALEEGMNKMNIVIIMVESLSKNYLGAYGGSSQTPFLDSLIEKSLVFPNGYANARESVQGIPAVLASIPALMDEPVIFSRYAGNHINSLASLLKPKGYNSTFFHGASTGTMGFHGFTKSIGFDEYVGKENYPEPSLDFDGSWGIWDHKFLPFMGRELSKKSVPFLAAILTLNSHHPFKIPTKFEARFKMEGHPIFSSIRYVDYSLFQFFESIKSASWYSNTLFIITADHTGPNDAKVKTPIDDYSIPIIFFTPNESVQPCINYSVANQIDIMPTILNLIQYNTPYFSLGNNLLTNQCYKFSVNYKMGIYQYIDEDHFIQFDGQKVLTAYDLTKDKFLNHNLIKNTPKLSWLKTTEDRLKKSIQVFNKYMIDDQMMIKNDDI